MSWILRVAFMALATAAVVAGCGGGLDRTKAQVRLVNASDYTQLDLRVHGERRQGGVAYANTAGYVEVDPDDADTQITNAGSLTALLSFTPSVTERKHHSMLAYGPVGGLKYVQLDEDQGQPDTNRTLVRVLNAAADAGAVDVYLTATADEALTSVVPVQAGAAYGTLGSFFTVDSRSWNLRVTAAGSKTDLRLNVPAVALGSKQIVTLVITAGAGGALVNALVVEQQGALTRLDGQHARVRAVAGVTDGGIVTVRLGADAVLLSGIASPAVGNYVLVPAGAQTLAVTVAGAALPATTQTLAAGNDYTLLVYGAPNAALVAPITDRNVVPTDTSMARIRLVNGVTGLASDASMTVDATPVGSGVGAGKWTDYATVTASTTAEIVVTSPGAMVAGLPPNTLVNEVDRTLIAGSTYTVFVLGSASTPRGVLRRDR